MGKGRWKDIAHHKLKIIAQKYRNINYLSDPCTSNRSPSIYQKSQAKQFIIILTITYSLCVQSTCQSTPIKVQSCDNVNRNTTPYSQEGKREWNSEIVIFVKY